MTLYLSPDKILKKNILLFVVLILLLTIMFAPFKLTIAKKREFRVADPNGIPVREAMVKQRWYQYSLGYKDEEIHKTDPEGYVFFPERTVKTSLFDLVSGAIRNILEYTIHASIGSSDSIYVYTEGYELKSFFDGEGLESGIVVLKKK